MLLLPRMLMAQHGKLLLQGVTYPAVGDGHADAASAAAYTGGNAEMTVILTTRMKITMS